MVPKELNSNARMQQIPEIKLESSSIKALIKSEKIPRVSTLIGNESSLTIGLMPCIGIKASTNENRIDLPNEPHNS